MRDIVLVGRHAIKDGEYGDIKVVEQRDIVWSLDITDVRRQLRDLFQCARNQQADILFQNAPGILAAALINYAVRGMLGDDAPMVGFVVQKTTPEMRSAEQVFDYPDEETALLAEAAVIFANGRAETSVDGIGGGRYTLTVKSVTPAFKMSHIEWVDVSPKS